MANDNNDYSSEYLAARKLGRRYVSEQNSMGRSGLLTLLESAQKKHNHGECAEIPLGTFEIPLDKIDGTFSSGRQAAFAGDFMPLLNFPSEFSSKWINVYTAHVTEGIRDPVKAYEYLGRYYIVEGNKRISVLKYVDAYSFFADVTRLLPPPDETDPEISIFYEFLDGDKLAVIKHMWFSAPGRLSKLRALRNDARAAHPEWPDDFMEMCYGMFRRVYNSLDFENLPITTGDAFLEFVNVYGFPIAKLPEGSGTGLTNGFGVMSEAKLATSIKNCEPQFRLAGKSLSDKTLSDPSELEKISSTGVTASMLSTLFGTQKKLSAAFVFAGENASSDKADPLLRYVASMHEVGMSALQKKYPNMQILSAYTSNDKSDAYSVISSVAKNRIQPDVVFVTNPSLRAKALRVALEAKNSIVLQCGERADSTLSTYYGRTTEAAFLCGVLAGSLTQTGKVGFIPAHPDTGSLFSDGQAFGQGAFNTRYDVRVLMNEIETDYFRDTRTLWKRGADIAWVGVDPRAHAHHKRFSGAYAYLCRLGRTGYPEDVIAVASWHWDSFYIRLIERLMEDTTETALKPLYKVTDASKTIHFRMGLSQRLLEVHPVYPSISPWTARLLTQFDKLMCEGTINPLDESMCVEIDVE